MKRRWLDEFKDDIKGGEKYCYFELWLDGGRLGIECDEDKISFVVVIFNNCGREKRVTSIILEGERYKRRLCEIIEEIIWKIYGDWYYKKVIEKK